MNDTGKSSNSTSDQPKLWAILRHAAIETILKSGIEKHMPQAAPSTLSTFSKVHAFARKIRVVILSAFLLQTTTAVGLIVLYRVINAPFPKTLALGLNITLQVYLIFLWLRFYWQTRFTHYLLGEHWWWTSWAITAPLSVISEFAAAIAGLLLLGLIVLGFFLRKRRACRMASEVQANLGRWDVLSSATAKDIALGQFP